MWDHVAQPSWFNTNEFDRMSTLAINPVRPTAASAWATALALTSLYGLCLLFTVSTAGVNLALALLLLATALAWRPFWQDIRQTPLAWLIGALTAYVVVHSLVFVHLYPEIDENGNPHWSDVARITGIVSLPIGWWISRHTKHLPWLLWAACLGLLIGLLEGANFAQLAADMGSVRRTAWGSRPNQVGYLAAAGYVGCFIAGTRALRIDNRTAKLVTFVAAWSFLLVFLLFLYGSGTRGAWLAATVATVLFLLVELYSVRRLRRWLAGSVLGSIGLLVVAIVVLGNLYDLDFTKRLNSAPRIVAALTQGDRAAVMAADRSTGQRLDMWAEGLRAVAIHPIAGWGLGGKQRVEQQASRPIRSGGHFHNLYLEIAVGLGLPGFALFLIIYGALARNLLGALRERPHDTPMLIAGLTFVVSLVVVFFEVRIGQTPGRTLWILVTGILIAEYFRRQQKTKTRTEALQGTPTAQYQ